MFLKTLDGNLVNSRYIARIYIEPDNEGDDYTYTDVIAEMANDAASFDETLTSFDSGDPELDLEAAKNFVHSLAARLNQQNVFVVNHILPVANYGD